MEWQPIETAPKDGTEVLLLGPDGSTDFGRWKPISKYQAGGVWQTRIWLYVFHDAVRWCAIPAPPQEDRA